MVPKILSRQPDPIPWEETYQVVVGCQGKEKNIVEEGKVKVRCRWGVGIMRWPVRMR